MSAEFGDSRLPARIWAKVRPHGDCWVWTASQTGLGYGSVWDHEEQRMARAHRVTYRILAGPIPGDLVLDHLCRNRLCVNPAHLEPVTHAENLRRGEHARNGKRAKRTHCPQGHPYDQQNTAFTPEGWRRCLQCRRANSREWYLQSKQRQSDASPTRMDAGAVPVLAAREDNPYDSAGSTLRSAESVLF